MRFDTSRLGMWPVCFVIDVPTGVYIWVHRQLISSPGEGLGGISAICNSVSGMRLFEHKGTP